MAVQARTDFNDAGLKLRGEFRSRFEETIEQDAGRSGDIVQWTIMGKKAVDVPTTGTPGTNTGNGTMTGVAAAGPVKVGTYTLACTFAVTNGGVFKLTDPDGVIVADNLTLRVGDTLVTSFVAGGLAFDITEGSTDFAAADEFTVAVTANGKYVPLDPTAADGSQAFAGIYNGADIAEADIQAGDTTGEIITGGDAAVIDNRKITIETGTLATVLPSGKTLTEEMEEKGLFPASTEDNYRAEN